MTKIYIDGMEEDVPPCEIRGDQKFRGSFHPIRGMFNKLSVVALQQVIIGFFPPDWGYVQQMVNGMICCGLSMGMFSRLLVGCSTMGYHWELTT